MLKKVAYALAPLPFAWFVMGCQVAVNGNVDVQASIGGTVVPAYSNPKSSACAITPAQTSCTNYELPLSRTDMSRVFTPVADAGYVFVGWEGDCATWSLAAGEQNCTVAGGTGTKEVKAYFRPATQVATYVKVAADGTELEADATEWACVIDRTNKLMWQVKTLDGGLHDVAGTFTWYNPLEKSSLLASSSAQGTKNGGTCADGASCDTYKYKQKASAQRLCGQNFWRLPSLRELNTLVVPAKVGVESLLVDGSLFPTISAGQLYWTSKFGLDGSTAVASALDFGVGIESDHAVAGSTPSTLGVILVRNAP